MAQTTVSAAEAALENQRIGGLQLRVAALCTLVQICDGYDLNSVAWAVPSLIKAWYLPPPMFTTAFLWSSIGILVGALSAGPIGDRFGRRPLLAVNQHRGVGKFELGSDDASLQQDPARVQGPCSHGVALLSPP